MVNEINIKEVCRILGKSKRTITRYIKAGKLNPKQVKNEKGIPEYRFDRSEVEKLKNPEATGQTTGQKQKVDQKDDDTLSLLKDNMKLLEKQLKTKDRQIKQLLERQRETNYLLKGLQDKVLLLEDKSKGKRQDKKHRTEDTEDTTSDTLSDRVKTFIDRLLGKNI